MGRSSQDPAASTEHVDFIALHAPSPAPSFLACPAGYRATEAGMTAPIFRVPWSRLRDAWTAVIAQQPLVVRIGDHQQGRRLIYISIRWYSDRRTS